MILKQNYKPSIGRENVIRLEELLRAAIDPGSSDQSIQILLQKIGSFFDASRVYILENNERGLYDLTYEWCGEQINPYMDVLRNFDGKKQLQWFQQCADGRDTARVECDDRLRETMPDLYEAMEQYHCRNAMVTALHIGDEIYGYLGISNASQEWMEESSEIFSMLGIFVNQLQISRNLIQKLERTGYIDHLTGAGNRHYLHDKVDLLPKKDSIGILYCDVTGLKKTNDMYGHDKGDALLKNACAVLFDIYGKANVYRIGGDEFFVLVTGYEQEMFRDSLRDLKNLMNKRHVNMAIGTAFEQEWKTDFDILMKQADLMMFDDKKTYYRHLQNHNEQNAVSHNYEAMLRIDLNALSVMTVYTDSHLLETPAGEMSLKQWIEKMSAGIFDKEQNEYRQFWKNICMQEVKDREYSMEYRYRNATGGWDWIKETVLITAHDRNVYECVSLFRNLSRFRKGIEEPEEVQEGTVARVNLYKGNEAFQHANQWISSRPDKENIVMIAMDLDHFKLYNAVFGRGQGDRLLELYGEIFLKLAHETGGIAGYLGRDNFFLLEPDDGLREEDKKLRFMQSLSNIDMPAFFKPSCGIYIMNGEELNATAMYDRAMLALDRVRNHYSHHIAFYDEKILADRREEALKDLDLEKAFKNHEFTFWLQPRVAFDSESIVSFKVLARWESEEGLQSAASFVPYLEKTGRIVELDEEIWTQVCRWLRRCREQGKELLPVVLNVTQRDLRHLEVAEIFAALMAKYGIDPQYLKLEIRNSALSDPVVQEGIGKLKKLNLCIQVNDFGEHYTSMHAVRDKALDQFCLKHELVEQMTQDEEIRHIVQWMLDTAKRYNAVTVATGIETKQQADMLKAYGCRIGQGNYFYAPMSFMDAESYLGEEVYFGE